MPSKFEVKVAASARLQALEAAKYIAFDSPQGAEAFIGDLDAAIESLRSLPSRGTAVPENKRWKAKYRQIFVEPYRVIYQIKASTVDVLSIVHGARRPNPQAPH